MIQHNNSLAESLKQAHTTTNVLDELNLFCKQDILCSQLPGRCQTKQTAAATLNSQLVCDTLIVPGVYSTAKQPALPAGAGAAAAGYRGCSRGVLDVTTTQQL